MKSKFKTLSQTDGKVKETSKIENTASEKPKADKKPVCKIETN